MLALPGGKADLMGLEVPLALALPVDASIGSAGGVLDEVGFGRAAGEESEETVMGEIPLQ